MRAIWAKWSDGMMMLHHRKSGNEEAILYFCPQLNLRANLALAKFLARFWVPSNKRIAP